ncbi:hypothetical protein WICPIJ_000487 [Wickerhamomyces pijperi]|uniref:Uncharacterized protein n=1 Tax=Wickerhamomyces pijperi TaxID=599730 RepID=A0A9P8QDG0_WICPI|nr:hypothetical protein WICPIJ_000487 [Wickerhamomyces pijperi]
MIERDLDSQSQAELVLVIIEPLKEKQSSHVGDNKNTISDPVAFFRPISLIFTSSRSEYLISNGLIGGVDGAFDEAEGWDEPALVALVADLDPFVEEYDTCLDGTALEGLLS